MFGPFDDIFDVNHDGIMDEEERTAETMFINDVVRKEQERGDVVDPFEEEDGDENDDENDIRYKDDDSNEEDDFLTDDF